MTEIMHSVAESFNNAFNYVPTHIVQAPGRVNLIGEHTDYNDGFVLPCAIDYRTIVAAAARDDMTVRVVSVDYDNAIDQFDCSRPAAFHADAMWANYIRGVVNVLRGCGFQFAGADIAVSGNVPQGAGLSSSAALEVVIGQTFKALYGLDISQADIARAGQRAENEFVGCNCGIMDQLISAKGEKNHALLIDCRSLNTEAVPMPDDMSVVIINSNKKRGLVDSEYNTRRQQCEAAAAFFGVPALRDVTLEELEARQHELDPVVARRARHVITENNRTVEAATALARHDMASMSQLMAESHISMRDDFEITVPEIDTLVNIVAHEIGEQGGVRMTGGGFGGCVVALVPPELVPQVVSAVEREYQMATGLKESIYVCRAEDGAKVLQAAG